MRRVGSPVFIGRDRRGHGGHETSRVRRGREVLAFCDHWRDLSGRQLVVCGLGRDTATVIISNDRHVTTKKIIERYARRMTIEQRLAESIRSFHLEALASAVPLNVDLDVVLSVLAGAVCASLRRRLGIGYTAATARHPQRGFLSTGGTIHTTNDRITVRSTGAADHPCSAPPTSPRPPSHGRATALSTSTTPDPILGSIRCVRIGVDVVESSVGRARSAAIATNAQYAGKLDANDADSLIRVTGMGTDASLTLTEVEQPTILRSRSRRPRRDSS